MEFLPFVVIGFAVMGGANLFLYRHRGARFHHAAQELRSRGRELSDSDELREWEFLSSDDCDTDFVCFLWWIHLPVNVYKYVGETFRIWDMQEHARSCRRVKVLNEP